MSREKHLGPPLLGDPPEKAAQEALIVRVKVRIGLVQDNNRRREVVNIRKNL